MNRIKRWAANLQLFTDDATLIDRTGAAALIPEENAAEIIQGAVEASTVLSLARRLANMGSGTYKMPVLSSLPIAYFVNGDNGQKKTTDQQWENAVITAEEIAVIVPIPQAVLDDSAYDIWAEVRPRIQEAFGKTIDEAVLFGTNKPASWPTALVTGATAASNAVTAGADLYQDIMGETGVIGKVEEDGFFVTGHVADISMRAKLRGLVDTNKQPIFKADMQTGSQYTLDGEPMYFPRNGSFDKTAALDICGDWTQLVYSIRQDITFQLFTDGIVQNTDGTIAYNLLQQDMVALRAVMRLGFALPNPVTGLQKTKAVRYPFAVLKPGA